VPELLDAIYEAAFIPELWLAALRGLADISESAGSTIFVFDSGRPSRGITLDNLADLLPEFLAVDALRYSTSVVRMCEAKPNSFVEVDSYMTVDEIAKDPIRIRLRERGIGVNACTAVPMPSGELVLYVLQKHIEDGSYTAAELERLNNVRPHLARAGLMAARLGFERARNTVTAMETLGLAAAVCSGERVLAANPLFLADPDTFHIGHRDRLSLTDMSANTLLQATLQSTDAANLQTVRSFPIAATETRGPGVLHAIPLLRTARDLFSGGDTVLVFTPVSATEVVPAPSLLSGLFDLSPSEARLAVSLAGGAPLKTAAEASDIKVTTARAYLEQIFRKTGTNQQSQLVALLKSAGVIRAR
jgi:DNA-binding CsgD family transcriptional regulator